MKKKPSLVIHLYHFLVQLKNIKLTLDRSSGEQKAVVRLQPFQRPQKSTSMIFQTMALVDNETTKTKGLH